MSNRMPRRDALRHLAVFSLSALAPAGLIACSKKPTCSDVTGLTSDELTQRNVTAAYYDQSMDAAKKCALCAQFVPAAPNACGTCKVVKGPINPEGTCKLFVPKPA
ncbi:MAG TPA: hypothetical protein VM925_16880 [Labilithrix sp.]|nr:hypothetical protein [Labilithrix sp.]